MPKKWTEEEEKYLEEHSKDMTYARLAEIFGVSKNAIDHKIRRLRKRREASAEVPPAEAVVTVSQDLVPSAGDEEKLDKKEISEEQEDKQNMVESPWFIKTEDGWRPLMMKKTS